MVNTYASLGHKNLMVGDYKYKSNPFKNFTEAPLFVSIIREYTNAFVPSWHEFKNPIAGEIGICRSQPFTNRRICSLLLINSEVTRGKSSILKQKQVEMTAGERLWMQETGFHRDGIFKLAPRRDKFINIHEICF